MEVGPESGAGHGAREIRSESPLSGRVVTSGAVVRISPLAQNRTARSEQAREAAEGSKPEARPPSPVRAPMLIAASDSFVQPRGVVTLHVRIQLLCVLLLLRCICEATTLFQIFPSDDRWNRLCFANQTGVPALVPAAVDMAQAAPATSLVGLASRMLHADETPPRPTAGAAEADENTIIASLLFYLFVFFEDGQGFLTFLLFGLQPPASLLPRSLLPRSFLPSPANTSVIGAMAAAGAVTPSRVTRRREHRFAEADDTPATGHGSRSTAGKEAHEHGNVARLRLSHGHIPRSESRDSANSPFMQRNLRHMGVPPREREPLSGQVTPSDQWSPALRKRWPPDSTGSGSSLADLDTEADGAAGREGCNTAAASSQGAAPGAPGATSLNLL